MRRFVANAFLTFILAWSPSARAGDTAPDLELHDLKGAAHKLTEYRGKPVVLNFWATWCVPCAREMPLLNEMQERYKGRVMFIAASIDDEEKLPDIPPFIKKNKGDALTVMTGATLDNMSDFGVGSMMPGTVLIDADGNIVDHVSGALKRADFIARLKKLAGDHDSELKPPKKTTQNRAKK